jgi:Zn-finger nucleic acid-binding protein
MAWAGENRCPLCRAALWAPDPEVLDTKSCPRCGADLWVFGGSEGPIFFPRRPGQTRNGFLAALLAPFHGVSADEMEDRLKHFDSLDLVELLLDLEDAMKSGRLPGAGAVRRQ